MVPATPRTTGWARFRGAPGETRQVVLGRLGCPDSGPGTQPRSGADGTRYRGHSAADHRRTRACADPSPPRGIRERAAVDHRCRWAGARIRPPEAPREIRTQAAPRALSPGRRRTAAILRAGPDGAGGEEAIDIERAAPPLTAEPNRTASKVIEAANRRLNRNDSVAVGIVNAAAPFLPVLLVRLGASGVAVGLITALPAVAGTLLALPVGRWLQGRRDIVPAYSGARLIAHTIYAPIALALWLAPADWTVAGILAIWAVAMVPNSIGQVAFPIVMDGAAGSRGRYDLLGRRWAIIGLVTAVTMAAGGQLLRILPFPMNYEVFLLVCASGGIGSFYFARRYVIPAQAAAVPAATRSPVARIAEVVGHLRTERPFAAFEVRALVYSAGIGLAAPLLPLFYVHEVNAPDAVIGLIGAGQSLGALAGYVTWRLISRRWGRSSVLVPALLLGALPPAAFFAIHDQVLVVTVSVVSGFGSAGAGLALFDELMRRVPMRLGVTFASIDQTIQNAALIAAPILGGTLSVAIGIRPALVLASVVSLAGFGLFMIDLYQARSR